MDFNDPKRFDDSRVFDDLKVLSIGSMDFDNPKVYGGTSIFDGLVLTAFNTKKARPSSQLGALIDKEFL